MNGLLHHLVLTFKLNFRSKQAIIYGYLVPLFFLVAFGIVFATKPPLQREMGQLITVTILGGACFGMPTTMVAERERGVWRRYRLLPTSTGGIILSAMVSRYFIILSAVVLQIVLAHCLLKSTPPDYHYPSIGEHPFQALWAFWHMPGTPWPEHPWQLLVAYTFVCFAFLGLGLVIAMLANDVPAVQALGQAIFLPMIMIGGVGVPLDKLHWVFAQHIAAFLPGRYAVQALEACHHGPGLSAAHFDLLSLTVIGLAGLLAGAKMFRWDVGQKLTGAARGWVAVAIVAWIAVGVTAEATGRLTSDRPTSIFASSENHSSDGTKKSAATQSDEYHEFDPRTAGFKLPVKLRSGATIDSLGAIIKGEIKDAAIDDEPLPIVEGHLYSLALTSNDVIDGKIHTAQFGDIRVRALQDAVGLKFMMTDSQLKKLQDFLVSQSAAALRGPNNADSTTRPTTMPAVVIVPPPAAAQASWEKITQAQIDSVTYDDLPDDNSTTTPLAPDLSSLDDEGKKRMDSFSDALSDWPPGKVEDVPQRIRNLLSICAVADVAEDQNEAHIPYIVFTYLKGTIPKAQLIKALTWVILKDRDGTVLTNVKDIKELSLDAEIQEDNVRDRSTLYAKKLLFRLLGKKPAN